jgi:hypothetical protein
MNGLGRAQLVRTALVGSLAAFLGLLHAGSAAAQDSDPSVVVLRGTRVSVASFEGPGPARERVVEHSAPDVEIHRGPRLPPEPRRPAPPPEPLVVYVVSETYVAAPVAVGWPMAHFRMRHPARATHYARHPRGPVHGGLQRGFLPRARLRGGPLVAAGYRGRGRSHGLRRQR